MDQSLVPSKHFQDYVADVVKEWEGEDDSFYRDRTTRTIAWYVCKVRVLEDTLKNAEIRTRITPFLEAVAQQSGLGLRRIQEARAVYQKFYRPHDGVKETIERIYAEAGSWSKALPPKPVEETNALHQHLFKCSCGQLQ